MTRTSSDSTTDLHVRVIPVPYVVTSKVAAQMFGRSKNWWYGFLKTREAAPLIAGSRVIRGTRVFKTETIINFIENAR